MDALDFSRILLPPVREFDRMVEIRAQNRENLRGRNNVTSCRSPTRGINTLQIKNELREKRQKEFLRRRSVSPEPQRTKPPPQMFSMHHYSPVRMSETFYTSYQYNPANGRPAMILTDGPSTSKWASSWSEQVTVTRQEKGQTRTQASTSTLQTKKSQHDEAQNTERRENSGHAQKTRIRTANQTENIHKKYSAKSENTLQKKKLKEAGVQTESGFITIKESEVQQLGACLQEALWREEAVKKKLAVLQESTANLLNSSNSVWTARCSEDLLRNKIKALEAQLQVALQKSPKDGVKKLLLQMEKQKLVYEEQALVALQKATQEKAEALSRADLMQEALITAQAEALRWQSLFEELSQSSGQLRENQLLSAEQLQQLIGQVELSREREAELQEEVAALRQERTELQYSVDLLEENNQMLREEIQNLRDGSSEDQELLLQVHPASEEAEPQAAVSRDSQVEEELRRTQEKLRLKQQECEELQAELHVMEQECQSSQARLTQCRDELRQLSHRHKRPTRCSSWWRLWLSFLLLLAVAQVVMLWMWYPPFREQVEDLYADVETRIEDYLMEMASPQHSGCFRPI